MASLEMMPEPTPRFAAIGLVTLPEPVLKLVGIEDTGTFDQNDISEMAKGGLIVQSIGFGQAVFREARSDEI